jgi:3-(3-hydroxy-phenyl)propionate hydroxylase
MEWSNSSSSSRSSAPPATHIKVGKRPQATMSPQHHYDAIVMGCGPVGALAANVLAKHGLHVAVVERNPLVHPLPRAISLDHYALTPLCDIVGQDLVATKLNFTCWEGGECCLNMDDFFNDRFFANLQLQEHVLGIPPCRNFQGDKLQIGSENFLFQPELETLLRNALKQQENVDMFLNFEALMMHESYTKGVYDLDGEYATHLTMQNKRETEDLKEISGTYVLGCDGGNSFVRKRVGIPLKVLGSSVHILVVDAIVSEWKNKPDRYRYRTGGVQIVDQNRPMIFLTFNLRGRCRWEFRLDDKDDFAQIQSPASVYKLLDPFVAKENVTLVCHTVQKFNSMIAKRWRRNNVFLCGDAAHQISPFLGQGLSMGFRNVISLCTKIVMVHDNKSIPNILDLYEEECYSPTEALIKEALNMGRVLFETSPLANMVRSLISTFHQGKPIDATETFLPQMKPLSKDIARHTLSVYARTNVQCKLNQPHCRLMFVNVVRCRIFCRFTFQLDNIARRLSELHSLIQPVVYRVVEEFKDKRKNGVALRKKHIVFKQLICTNVDIAELFRDANYIVMGRGNNVIGTFRLGDEEELIARYTQHCSSEKACLRFRATDGHIYHCGVKKIYS